MSQDHVYSELIKICGENNVSNDASILQSYASDLSFVENKKPIYITWPNKSSDIKRIVKLANKLSFSIIPISSGEEFRLHGDTIPKKNNCVIVNLSKMKKIHDIDKKNRVIMLEPGVTFGELIPKLKKKGVRILHPLYPRASKSVVASALEREPLIIPRYMWDSSDPLLCTEIIFGTGDLFKTGSAAGPGTLKEKKKAGIALVNPMGPTQFSPFRVIQGAQGSLGIVTWATLKLEMKPDVQKVFHVESDQIQELLDFQIELIQHRLCDELFIVNNLNLGCLVKRDPMEIIEVSNKLKKWNLIFVMAGRGKLKEDKLEYLEGDTRDIMNERKLSFTPNGTKIEEADVLNFMNNPIEAPWRLRFKGACQDIFFVSNLERIPEFVKIVESQVSKDLGIYIQPLNQGTSYHCEFDLYHALNDPNISDNEIKEEFLKISKALMEAGAFFNRPYGVWAEDVYERHSEGTQKALKKVKNIFDPNNVLNPGVLCFKE